MLLFLFFLHPSLFQLQLKAPLKWSMKSEGNLRRIRVFWKAAIDLTMTSVSILVRRMILPTFVTLASPILVGLVLGPFALGGMLLGGTCTAALLASFFTFGGALWDNTKKNIEGKAFWLKGSPIHTASVVGDTVGDPLKDVAGPSLNIFMKLTNMTALLIAPLLLSITPLIHLA